jgi:hypothetical protein
VEHVLRVEHGRLACVDAHPEGAVLFQALLECICATCPNSCTVGMGGACGG